MTKGERKMRDWLFRLLFPSQWRQLKHLNELLKVGKNPDFVLSAPDGICFKDIRVYLVTNAPGETINSQWMEIPYEEVLP